MPGARPSGGAWLWHGEKGKGEPGKAWDGHRDVRDKGRLPGEDGLKREGPWASGLEQWRIRPLSYCCMPPSLTLETIHCGQGRLVLFPTRPTTGLTAVREGPFSGPWGQGARGSHLACGLRQEPLQGGTDEDTHAREAQDWNGPTLPGRRVSRCCTRVLETCTPPPRHAPFYPHTIAGSVGLGGFDQDRVWGCQDGRGLGGPALQGSERAIYR